MDSRSGVGSASASVLARRRNGKQQACEPCRKAKIACDHSLPTCDRCRRRKVTEKCVYHAAPMTKTGSGQATYPSRIEIGKSHRQQPLPTPSPPATVSIASPKVSTTLLAQTPKESRSPANSGPFIKSGGFFGPTNFSAVFLENRDNLVSGNEEMQISNDSEDPLPPSESLQSQTFLMLATGSSANCSPRVELGVKVLRSLPDKSTCNFLLEWYSEKCHSCVGYNHVIMSCAKSVWQTYDPFLAEPTPKNMQHVSATLCENSRKILEEPTGSENLYSRWLDSFCGSNMRWETVGLVFCALTQATLSLQERDAFFCTQTGNRKDRKTFAVEMKDCVQACITLSNWMDLINLPMVSLLSRNLVLQTVISGDTSKPFEFDCMEATRRSGERVNCTGAPQTGDYGTAHHFLTEMKKRVFTSIFNFDKSTSVLTGRPPALSYRYTRFKFPLDLSDEVTMAGGDELIAAISKLDKDGWNTDGEIYTSTLNRVHGIDSVILDETLELSLGDPADCTEERTTYLMQKLQNSFDSLPSHIHFSYAEPPTGKRSDSLFWKVLCIRLSYLDHRLLLERIAYKHGWLDGQSMVDCATELLELTVLIWVQRDRFVVHEHDFDWMLMVWGVPSSGVLCVELLKQLKNPGAPHPRFKRSEIFQNLSLLIGFLDWVRPTAGNYQLCTRMKLIIKRILDQILDPSPPSASVQQADSVGLVEPMGDWMMGQSYGPGDVTGPFDMAVPPPGAFDINSYENGVDNLDWLNSIDWSRGGPWIDFGAEQDMTGIKGRSEF
ncbi:hypothetical protein LSUB1_G006396 [Lachnellula subtilissima]|uniref:Zn(2)-C6 fungal-type domain-containing protein n=1 Tax=Lachnellula subtilissima TaxID=602034 RepID=A0A8H8U4Y0_9HELO|nr:hypothetical protein LSUB1_G006396 [Lachnellula subtilissima]